MEEAMKHLKLLTFALGAALVAAAEPASATRIAGWDASQYVGAGFLSIDGSTGADTLPANYSELDTVGRPITAGPPGIEYGRLYYNGQFGSTPISIDGTGTEPFNTGPGSLTSNLSWPAATVPFDSSTDLQNDGQAFYNPLTFLASETLSVVFGVDSTLFAPSAPGIVGWSLSLAGKTLSGGFNLGVEFSTDGTTYAPVTTFQLTSLDTLFTTPLPNLLSQTGFVKLNFTGATAAVLPQIDNIGISGTIVPEPGTALLIFAGLAGLAASGRRRQ
jgi:hypothetical protein